MMSNRSQSYSRRSKMKGFSLRWENRTGTLALLTVGIFLLVLTGFTSQSYGGVRVGIGINLPAYTFAAPPPVVVIPGTYAYYAPDADVDIVFYSGYWYRPYEGHWFRSRGYNGPWATVAPGRIPGALLQLPPDYRHAYREHPRIEYRNFNRNWRNWEKRRHWERDERWREGRGGGRRDERREERREERRQEHRGR